MKDWQERVIVEEGELTIKIVRLSEFIENNSHMLFDKELERMSDQLYYMGCYRDILKERIANFSN